MLIIDKHLIKYYLWYIYIFISIFCDAQVLSDLQQCNLTFEMLDASGKIPSGILSNNIFNFGSYDQCLGINDISPSGQPITGKYCLVKVKLSIPLNKLKFQMNHRVFLLKHNILKRALLVQNPRYSTAGLILGLCIPDTCPINNITNIILPYLNVTNASISPLFHTGMCQTKTDLNVELNTTEFAVFGFLIIIATIMITSTIYDIYLHYNKKEIVHIVLTAFSIKTNGEKLLTISNNPNQLPCLYGIRFLSMMWVIFGHRVSTSYIKAIINRSLYEEWTSNPINMYVINAPLAVDTFFLLSGLLVSYGFLLTKEKGINFNIFIYYLHRYLRLTPPLAFVILLQINFLSHFGSGPIWPLTAITLQNDCKNYWWSALLYIQNYYNCGNMCIGQTWFLSADTQLFVLSPLILIPLWKWPKYTIIGSVFLVLGSVVISFQISYWYGLPGFLLKTNPIYLKNYYYSTHTRFGPWLIGILLGYYIFKAKTEKAHSFYLNPVQVFLGWLMSISLLLSTLFAGNVLVNNPDPLGTAFFNGLHRHGWSLGVCWVIYACTQGYGGLINMFLSWSVFQILSRFTYSMYLIHFSLQLLMASAERTGSYFSNFNNAYYFWGDFAFSLFFAICLTLTVESPMLTLEKVLFGTGLKKKITELPIQLKELENNSGQTNEGFEKTE